MIYKGVIYQAISPNGKKYIGQTTSELRIRKNAHKTDAYTRNRKNYFYRAIRKYGFEKFKWEILESHECEDRKKLYEILNEREAFFTFKFNSFKKEFGYNEKIGGGNGFHLDKTKEKIRNSLIGKKHSADRRKNQSMAHKGKDYSKNFGSPKFGKDNPNYREISGEIQKQIIDLHVNEGWGSKKLERKFGYSFVKILKFLREKNVYKPGKFSSANKRDI